MWFSILGTDSFCVPADTICNAMQCNEMKSFCEIGLFPLLISLMHLEEHEKREKFNEIEPQDERGYDDADLCSFCLFGKNLLSENVKT